MLIDIGEFNLAATTAIFGAIVCVSAILQLKIAGIAPRPSAWGLKYNIYNWTRHAFYIGGTLLGWIMIEQIAQAA